MLQILLAVAAAGTTPLQVGLTCATTDHTASTDPGLREECDHMRFLLSIINNKTDGFMDGVLPGVELVTHDGGCCDCPSENVSTVMRNIYANIRTAMPNLTAILGGHCSGALMSMTSASYREALGERPHLFLSGSSTAPSIANNSEFPNVIRTVSDEVAIAEAVAAFAWEHNGWRRVGVVSTSDSVWSIESADAFERIWKQRGGEVLRAPSSIVQRSVCAAADSDQPNSAARVAARTLIDHFVSVGARVLFMPINPDCQRALLRRGAPDGPRELLRGLPSELDVRLDALRQGRQRRH